MNVGIFDSNYKQLFPDAQIVKIDPRRTSKMMEHPIESGSIITDFKVINPTIINVSMMITSKNYKSVYASIENAYKNSTSLIVQTNARVFKNIVISDMPHSEDPDHYNSLMMALSLKEVFTVSTKAIITKAKKGRHAPSVAKGQVQPKSSVLYNMFH